MAAGAIRATSNARSDCMASRERKTMTIPAMPRMAMKGVASTNCPARNSTMVRIPQDHGQKHQNCDHPAKIRPKRCKPVPLFGNQSNPGQHADPEKECGELRQKRQAGGEAHGYPPGAA